MASSITKVDPSLVQQLETGQTYYTHLKDVQNVSSVSASALSHASTACFLSSSSAFSPASLNFEVQVLRLATDADRGNVNEEAGAEDEDVDVVGLGDVNEAGAEDEDVDVVGLGDVNEAGAEDEDVDVVGLGDVNEAGAEDEDVDVVGLGVVEGADQ